MKTVSSNDFDRFVAAFMAILASYGYTPQTALLPDRRFHPAAEQWLVGFLFEVEDEISPLQFSIPINLSNTEIDHITLKCALVLKQAGIKGLGYKECLNATRAMVADLLKAMGYEEPMVYRPEPFWWCYKLWERVAKGDLSEDEIIRLRAHGKENCDYYEE